MRGSGGTVVVAVGGKGTKSTKNNVNKTGKQPKCEWI